MKKELEGGKEIFDKKILETKNDVGRQMHEICGMVEEIANMSKRVENQLVMIIPEIE
jgi:threonine dehydrogenase-like Zn-dependent dehydrogenase